MSSQGAGRGVEAALQGGAGGHDLGAASPMLQRFHLFLCNCYCYTYYLLAVCGLGPT